MISGRYTLVLICDAPDCPGWHWHREPYRGGRRPGRRAEFSGENGDAMRARAIKKGWLFIQEPHTRCPKCAKGAG